MRLTCSAACGWGFLAVQSQSGRGDEMRAEGCDRRRRKGVFCETNRKAGASALPGAAGWTGCDPLQKKSLAGVEAGLSPRSGARGLAHAVPQEQPQPEGCATRLFSFALR